jgi:hypothetical protein
MKKFCVLCLGLLLCQVAVVTSVEAGPPAESPDTRDDGRAMVYLEYRILSPKIEPGSFGASIRKVWRSGDRYLRTEEAPDPQQHIHGVIIINEPNVWMWNRFDNSAKHIVDPGPTYVVHDPLFSGEPSKGLQRLEIGREKDFFSVNKASQLPDETIDDVVCATQSLTVDGSMLTLYLRKSDGSPFQISIKNKQGAYAVRYEKYESRLRLDPALFGAPKEAKISEAN